MKNILITAFIIITYASCIPPGKLNEALEVNKKMHSQIDSLKTNFKDTISNYTSAFRNLNQNLICLQDSIVIYQTLAKEPVALTKGDLFLNRFGNENKSINLWLDTFKTDIKKYTDSEVEVKLDKGFVFVDIPVKILFASGSSKLTPESSNVLSHIAQLLKVQPNLNLIIEGHTDSGTFKKSSKIDNWTLSVIRSSEVARIFQVKYMIDPKRMIAAGRGEYMPIDNNLTQAGRLNNRRIRIILLPSLENLIGINN